MIVLQYATSVNEALLFSGDVAVASDDILEGIDGGIDGNLDRKLGTVRAANVDVDVDVDPFGFLNGTVTSHALRVWEARHSHTLAGIGFERRGK